jgi:hypothetical protein
LLPAPLGNASVRSLAFLSLSSEDKFSMSKSFLVIIILVLLGAGAWLYRRGGLTPETSVYKPASPAAEDALGEKTGGGSLTETPKPRIISFTDSGYTPSSITIERGTAIVFRNQSSGDTWPASAMHPTHDAYSVKGGCIGSVFDACRGLKPGENWSFRFDAAGAWCYHDHLNPRHFVSIRVE